MEKITKYLWIVSGILVAYLCLCGVFGRNARQTAGEALVKIDFVGQCRIGDGELQTLSVLEDMTRPSRETIHLYGHFTQGIEKNLQVMFRLNKINMNLWVNGEKVFTYGQEEERMSLERSGGNVWATWVSMGIDTSDDIQIDITNNYKNSGKNVFSAFLENIYVGCEHALFLEMLQSHAIDIAASLLLCISGIFIGIVSWVSSSLVGISNKPMKIFSIWIFACGIWSCISYDYISLLIPYPFLLETVDEAALLCVCMLFGCYIYAILESSRKFYLDIGLMILMVVYLAELLGICFGWWTFCQMQPLNLIFTVLMMLVGYIPMFLEKQEGKNSVLNSLFIPLSIYMGCTLIYQFSYLMGDRTAYRLYKWSFFIVLIVMFYILFQDLRRNIEKANRASELEKEVIQSRISVMLSQIRPHFLFNSLNAISGLCLADPVKADEAIVDFSEYLRENIRALECQNPVSFEQELTHTRNYLKVEKMRFGDRIDVDYDIEFVDFTMPTLTLQPIVENAIRHGIGKVKEGGIILIKSEQKEQEVIVSVVDNGVGFDPQILKEIGDNHGLENVRLRLDYMLGAKLNIESQPNMGTTVSISIPMIQEEY